MRSNVLLWGFLTVWCSSGCDLCKVNSSFIYISYAKSYITIENFYEPSARKNKLFSRVIIFILLLSIHPNELWTCLGFFSISFPAHFPLYAFFCFYHKKTHLTGLFSCSNLTFDFFTVLFQCFSFWLPILFSFFFFPLASQSQ